MRKSIDPKELRIAFFGTPDFATAILDELESAGITPALVVTAPDRPAGRGMQLTPPPAKVWAQGHDIDVLQPERIDGPPAGGFLAEMANTEWDLFVVAAYGLILPKALVDMPRHGTLNVHPSLLPKLRGASPVQSAVLTDARDAVGVTIMQVDEKMDHGPIVAQARIELAGLPDSEGGGWPIDAALLEDLLAHAGGELLAETIPAWVEGTIEPEPQNDEKATYCEKIEKSDGKLDLGNGDSWQNFLTIKALGKRPGAFFFADPPAGGDGREVRVKVLDAEYKDGKLHLTRVIPEGKSEMSYDDFLQWLG